MNIIWKGSPNKDSNRKTIDRIVIHWFGVGTLDSADARFQVPANQVSAHYGISDDIVYQWVKETDVAYHAGNYAMNQRSIGIEHDATTEHDLSEKSYKTSAELIRQICIRHNIPMDREHIIGHKEVKATQCPGTINLDKLIEMAKEDPCEVEKEKYKTEARAGRETIKKLETEKSKLAKTLDDLTALHQKLVNEDKIEDAQLKKLIGDYDELTRLYKDSDTKYFELDQKLQDQIVETNKMIEENNRLKSQKFTLPEIIKFLLQLLPNNTTTPRV